MIKFLEENTSSTLFAQVLAVVFLAISPQVGETSKKKQMRPNQT